MTGRPRAVQALLRRPERSDAERLLLAIPYLGTGASLFRTWERFLDGVEVCPVQLPGRENRIMDQMPETYGDLAVDLADELAPVLDRPFSVFGHCASAYIALELGTELGRRGLPLESVVVSSMVPPDEAGTVAILQTEDDQLPDYANALLRSRGIDAPSDVLDLVVEVLRQDLEVYRSYRWESSNRETPLVLLGWQDDEHVPRDAMDRWVDFNVTDQSVLPGDHWAFLDLPTELVEVFRASITAKGDGN